ncbi:E3 ubiquitin--protein ligase [Salmonella enterica]|uniref:E3 ubiquitin-protein ligase SspH2 n=1 Tax=Salmonella enterica TaxID=28901 RepID=A0A629KC10_SALER|nr:NEL-type E3 ubiquitin ligase domain-containing protein [Salmonella enterica]EBP9137431.1 E3 ubiquitin--protein ligase [Salmonella enterica subsp. enterica]EAA4613694.1 E3 ubiquitin--protein ligase [Salmonella enterica subsp. enterica serovar Muenchen]EAM1815863.1 E3 ubiquitin--protein ligase [Salmonella enterica]EAT4592970.1 E3 ubiquitin--protein ligase [Salmonella enterica]EAV6577341.1 E3 ubiquitin--protein ligase [Salmonella enterica]
MPFHIGSGCLPATISNRCIYRIAWSDTPPEMSSWEKMKEFFCSTHQTEALECIWAICHPPAGTTREDVINRFELLRTLAYAGWEESIHSGQHGENYFCILDEDSQEILSVTLDDAGNYTVNCQGYSETHRLTLDTAQGEEGTGHAEGASGTFRTSFLPATTAPQTPAEYDAVWSAWRRAAPAEESRGRAAVVQKMRACLNNGNAVLNVGESGLTTLPDCLPAHITTLVIPDNNLTSLPALPPELRTLEVSGNQLTRLPESLIHLSSETTVNLEGNPLSERTLQALREITSAPGYSGPIIQFDMAGASAPRETRALHLAAADWLVPAREGEPAPADRWHMFGQEDNADAFSLFLDRLSETENFIKDAGFKAQISSWLAQLAEDEALRANTFAMATEATSSCEDRVTFFLHQMKNVQLVHNAEKGQYDNDLAALVATGREMFRLGKLEQIAREKVRTLALVDEIEVWLAYQNKLKKSLGLTSVTSEMRFFDVSGVTVTDLQDAELQVKAAEKSEFREWILQWGPLHRVLERKAPERVNALREKQISDYEETYRMLSDTELRPSGLVGNTDAERTIGARAMESAKKTFLDDLRPLVEEMLGSYLNVQWRRN